MRYVKGKLATTTLSLGGYEIREVTGHTGAVIEREERSSFGNGVRVMRHLGAKGVVQPQTSYEFAAKDHLGSDTATFDGQGQLRQQRGHLKPGEVQKTERQSYDAWGARRDGDTWAPASGQLGTVAPSPPQGNQAPPPERAGSNLPRGYTGHEMLDDVGLVHMNGRLYDSALGRMCAADRDVQAPDMIQNYNRYSYVLNNPMNATDPSGHNWFKKILMIIVAIIIAVILIMVAVYAIGALAANAGGVLGTVGSAATATSAATAGTGLAGVIAGTTAGAASALGSFMGLNVGIWLGATVGAAWSAVNTTIAGGTFGDVLKAAVIGAANGAVNAIIGGYMHGLGVAQGSMLAGGTSISGTAIHLAAHGVAGGAMSAANGGTFKDGFIGGIVGAGISGVGTKLFGNTTLYDQTSATYRSAASVIGRTAIASVSGGLASVALGGKFADGAYSAAFFHLFNQEASDMWEISDRSTKTFAFYDSKDKGGAEMENAARYYAGVDNKDWVMDLNNLDMAKFAKVMEINDIHRVMIIDHSFIDAKLGFGMQFGKKGNGLTPTSSSWVNLVNAIPTRTKIVFASCLCGDGSKQSLNYMSSLGISAKAMGKEIAIYGYSSTLIPVMGGLGGISPNPSFKPYDAWWTRQYGASQQMWKK
jgi:RHS repeat-associated protein